VIDVRLSEKAPYPLFDITIALRQLPGAEKWSGVFAGSYNDPRGASRYRRWAGVFTSVRELSPDVLKHDVGRTSQSPKPGAGHQRLNVFVSTWHTEGQQCEGPIGPAANIRDMETNEWLPPHQTT
jgi:hypothetical protein